MADVDYVHNSKYYDLAQFIHTAPGDETYSYRQDGDHDTIFATIHVSGAGRCRAVPYTGGKLHISDDPGAAPSPWVEAATSPVTWPLAGCSEVEFEIEGNDDEIRGIIRATGSRKP